MFRSSKYVDIHWECVVKCFRSCVKLAKFNTICFTYAISNVMIYVHMFHNLKHEILAKTMNDYLFRGVMKIRFAVTL